MKKIILFSILIFSSFCFAENINDFLGVPFFSSRSDAVKTFTEKGFEVNSQSIDDITLHKDGITFLGNKISSGELTLGFYKNYLILGSISLIIPDDENRPEKIFKLIDYYLNNFDTPTVTNDKIPYEGTELTKITFTYNNNVSVELNSIIYDGINLVTVCYSVK